MENPSADGTSFPNIGPGFISGNPSLQEVSSFLLLLKNNIVVKTIIMTTATIGHKDKKEDINELTIAIVIMKKLPLRQNPCCTFFMFVILAYTVYSRFLEDH